MLQLQSAVERLGEELVGCDADCEGICRNQDVGLLPRGFYLERPDAPGRGCYAVGLNPGQAKQEERDYFLAEGTTYRATHAYWDERKTTVFHYFRKARSIIDQLGLSGPILWSNLAKCESPSVPDDQSTPSDAATASRQVKTFKKKTKPPPLSTSRYCANKYLRRELAMIPSDWAILAIGYDPFFALSYMASERAVVGIPHATGGSPDFNRMISKGLLHQDLRERAIRALNPAAPGIAWLGRKKVE